jgi:hypothetical protein
LKWLEDAVWLRQAKEASPIENAATVSMTVLKTSPRSKGFSLD